MKSLLWFQTAIIVLLFSPSLTAQPSIGGYNVYFGSLHSHSEVSDGIGTPDEAYNFAKNTSHLDFFGLSDHSDYITESEWTAMKTAADTYNEPGVFTSFRGFEWTTYTYGHLTVVNSEVNCPAEAPVITFTDLCNWLTNHECVAFFNHPGYANNEGKEFNHFSTPPNNKIIGMELWTSYRDFNINYYNDGYYCNDENKGYFDEALTRNWKIGALGSEDNHSGTWGNLNNYRMAVLAAANTRDAIYNALKEKRFYSTLDKNLCLSFQINGAEMGSTVAPGTYQLRIRASDADGELFSQVQLLKNSAVINTWNPNLASPDLTLNLTFDNNHYYYVRVKQADGNEAISSPIWISNGNLFPTASVTSPVANQVFLQPANIPITVSAADQDGTISKVDFYQGCTYLGTDDTTPYTYSWTNVVAGTYELTAKATDNTGGSTYSLPITITVKPPNQPPVVSLTSPPSGATYTAPALVTLNATATDPDGTVVKVDFYQGNTLLNSDTSTPYSFDWTNVVAGTYELTAKATDNTGAATTSLPITITVKPPNQPPAVTLTSPAPGATYTAPATVTLNATATDPDGTVVKVDFYQGSTLLNSDTSTPYSFDWTNVVAGTYELTAKATDNTGAATTSLPITITVKPPNQPPAVALTSPAPGATYTAPATVTLNATATDPDGTVVKVDFYQGSTLLNSDTSAPYSFNWTNVLVGNYSITAKATDNAAATTVSSPVAISVVANQPPVVQLTSPGSGDTYTAPATILLNATATDPDGTITQVAFYYGENLLFTDNSNPYSYTVWGVPQGSYTLTARATDNAGTTVTSTAVAIQVNAPTQLPNVSITSPMQGEIFSAPATINIIATASDADGIAKVEFFYGGSLLGSDNTSPYSYTANNVPAGNYQVTAKATDNLGISNETPPLLFSVVANQVPVVSVTSPQQGAAFTAPASIVFSASASDADGTIVKVEFYQGNTLLQTDDLSPYSFNWTNVPVGNYTLTAKAFDNLGAFNISSPVAIVVTGSNQLPVITVTNPRQGDIFAAPATIQVTASATDLDGTIARVDFYYKGTVLSTDNSSPYSYTATNIGVGEYTISAQATDNEGGVKMSDPVTFTVVSNQPPVIFISSPASGSIYTAPASIVFTASATDSDGSVAKVDFYQGNTLLWSDNQSPYTYNWNNVPAGVYTLTARATDNTGLYTISPAVNITVNTQQDEYTITKRIQTGADDVEERASGIMLLNSDDIEFVYDTNTTGNQIVGLRFRGITVPNGATIISANIQFTVDEADAGSCNLVIRGEKTGNAQPFTSTFKNVSSRTKTSASVAWSPPAWTTVGTAQLTPNIGVIVQEIINSVAWSSGNNMVFIFTGTGTRTAESYEANQATAALLTIKYTTVKSVKLPQEPEWSGETAKVKSAESSKLSCYPVPFTHELNINFIPAEGEYAKKLEMLNSNGKYVFVTGMSKNQISMDMQQLKPGVYVVRIVTNTGTYNKLVLKN